MAASASPTCRIAARSSACRPAFTAGSRAIRRSSTPDAFEQRLAEAADIEFLLVGIGTELRLLPPPLREAFRAGRHLGRPDGDRRRGAHLQRAAGRGPRRRGRADRRRLTWHGAVDARRRPAAQRRPRPLSRRALCAARTSAARCFALYAFNAEIAGVRDRVREPLPGEIRLQWWRDADRRRAPRRRPAIPSPRRCSPRSRDHGLPRQAFASYLEARIFDLYDDPMPTRQRPRGLLRRDRLRR